MTKRRVAAWEMPQMILSESWKNWRAKYGVMLGLNTAESEKLRKNSDSFLHRGSVIRNTVNVVSFMTLGPVTLKDTICIGQEERTKDIWLSFG